MAQYKKVEGLIRGIELLRLIGTFESGRARVTDLTAASGLHRTTVKRLLETLRSVGYLTYDEKNRRYYLALKARQLSEGFVDEKWIVATASPALLKLQSEVVWPTDLATPEGDQMVIRESTRRFSPFSFHRSMTGTRLPMLTTSVGRAYLGYCSGPERKAIATYVDARSDSRLYNGAYVEKIAKETRQQGYGSSFGDWSNERKFGGIAVPIQVDGRVFGCINVVFLRSSILPEAAVEKFVAPLWNTAKNIGKTLSTDRRLNQEIESLKEPVHQVPAS